VCDLHLNVHFRALVLPLPIHAAVAARIDLASNALQFQRVTVLVTKHANAYSGEPGNSRDVVFAIVVTRSLN